MPRQTLPRVTTTVRGRAGKDGSAETSCDVAMKRMKAAIANDRLIATGWRGGEMKIEKVAMTQKTEWGDESDDRGVSEPGPRSCNNLALDDLFAPKDVIKSGPSVLTDNDLFEATSGDRLNGVSASLQILHRRVGRSQPCSIEGRDRRLDALHSSSRSVLVPVRLVLLPLRVRPRCADFAGYVAGATTAVRTVLMQIERRNLVLAFGSNATRRSQASRKRLCLRRTFSLFLCRFLRRHGWRRDEA